MEGILMLAGVMIAVVGGPMFAVAVVPMLVKAIGRAFGEGRPESDVQVQTELEDLRARVQQLEERESRMVELEERMEFTERVLARGGTDARLSAEEV